MKMLATGDWHAGVSGALTLDDQEQVWHRIVDVALKHDVDAFIHGGDLYNGPIVSMEQIAAVRRVFNRLRDAKVPVLLIRGNSVHDLAVRPVDALDIFNDYDGIYVYTRPTVSAFGNVAFCLLPWVAPGRLLAQTNGDVDRDKVNEYIAELLAKVAHNLRQEAADLPAVLVAHWSISTGALPSGLPVADLREPVINWADLDAVGFDAVIAAHIHRHQRLDDPRIDDTVGFYVGSPQPLSHGEPGEHGCYLLSVGDGPATAEFVPITSKRFLTLLPDAVDNFSVAPWLDAVSDGAVVRVRYEASEDEAARADHAAISRALLEAGASRVQIEPQIVRKDRARVTTVNEQLSQAEALAAWCDANEIDSAMRERMIERLGAWA